MQKLFVTCISVLILILSFSAFANLLVNLPLKDNISPFNEETYDFVYRVLTKRAIEGIPRGTLPLSRGEICDILLELKKKQEDGVIKLSKTDQERLKAILAYFSDEMHELGISEEKSNPKNHILELKDEQYKFWLDLSLLQESRTRNGKSFSEEGTQYATSVLPAAFGQVRDDFAFSSLMAYRFLWGDFFTDTFVDESRYRQFSGRLYNTATINTYLLFKLPWFSLQFGKDKLRWGPGYHGALMISENSRSMDMIKLSASYKTIKFNSFTAILQDGEDSSRRYMSGHRIEGFLWNRIGLGFSETIVYGKRFEPGYLNPVTIYLIAEPSYSPDINDNVLASADMRILLNNVELYGEIMVDDYNFGQGFYHWDNKFGILGGLYITDPLGIKDTDILMEYTFINQYCYTHEDYINAYKHFDSVIGHQIGTDADDIWFQLKHRFTDKLETTLAYELERHGEGDIKNGNPPSRGTSKWTYLSGIIQSEHSLSFGLSYTHIGRYRFGMEYKFSRFKNYLNQESNNISGQEITVEGIYRF